MKRIAKFLLPLTMVALLATACGQKAENATETPAPTENKPAQTEMQEITFMIPDWGAPNEELLAEFEAQNGIKVNVNTVGWDDIRNKISTAAVGGEAAADVVEVDWSWAGEFNAADWLEPIDMSAEDIADMPSIAPFMIDNKVLAVPYANDYRIAYYNKAMFEQAGITTEPKTWDEVVTAAKAIKEKGIAKYPITIPMNADESATTSMIWMALTRNGVVFNEDGTLNKDSMVDALTFTNQLVKDELIDPANQSGSGMDAYRKITAGEAAFMVGPTSFVSRVNDEKESKVIGQVVPILLPGRTATSEKTYALPEAVGVLKLSKNKEAAQTFVKWYTSPEIQVKLNETNNTIPTRNSVLEKLIQDGKIKDSGAMLEQGKLIMSPFTTGIPSYYSEMSNAIYNNINSMVTGNQSPEQAFDAMDAKIKELLKK
ncbi:MAG: sugar ABC transporter substrate-binding protein [Peptostreptococcaceae bacterium]|nr:sugar ABC transporter substrate-binding protein [Peptostreptococcaceae bacterium]